MNGLPKWEQLAFMALNFPFSLITMILCFILWIPFRLMIATVLPFLLFTTLGSAVWVVCLAVLVALSWATERLPLFRPVGFIVAVPFMIIGHNLNGLTPAPGPGDIEAKIFKWDLIEAYPWTWSFWRFCRTQVEE